MNLRSDLTVAGSDKSRPTTTSTLENEKAVDIYLFTQVHFQRKPRLWSDNPSFSAELSRAVICATKYQGFAVFITGLYKPKFETQS